MPRRLSKREGRDQAQVDHVVFLTARRSSCRQGPPEPGLRQLSPSFVMSSSFANRQTIAQIGQFTQ
jgi:hypothetical protein